VGVFRLTQGSNLSIHITYYTSMNAQITYEDVATAAEQLKTEGRPIGPTKVRELLGRGSYSTVQKYLQEWDIEQAKLKSKAEEERRIGPPDELFSELQKLVAAYWPHAISRAKELMRPDIEALQAQLAAAEARNKEAMVEMGNLENTLEGALVKAAKMEESQKAASEANQKIITLQRELSRLEKIEARFEGQQQLIENLQGQASSVKSLMAENTALNKRLEASGTELNAARIKIATLETRLEMSAGKK
jgi:hypothetical protein